MTLLPLRKWKHELQWRYQAAVVPPLHRALSSGPLTGPILRAPRLGCSRSFCRLAARCEPIFASSAATGSF
jgi:hypothetical protein